MLIPEQARTADWTAALELAFTAMPETERQRLVGNALALLAGGEIDPQGVWVARDAASLAGVQLCELLGGATCLLWTPAVRPDWRESDLAQRLVGAALAWAERRGCKLAQALLPASDTHLAGPLVAEGFRPVTELVALRHDLHDLPALAGPPLRYVTYSPATHALFEQTLLRTYAGTLDCPELNGVRTIEEILAGHRAAGRVRPELWWLAYEGDQPVGVLLLTDLPHGLDWELAYVGVIPEARSRGLGRALTLHALHAARQGEALHLILAVDARNAPARQLYTSLGFVPAEVRFVYLYFFPRPDRAAEE